MKEGSYFASSVEAYTGTENHREHVWVIASSDLKERYSEKVLDGHRPFSEAPFEISLSGVPRPGLTLSAEAYVAHVFEGKALQPMADTYQDVVSSIDRFVSFDGSFASQQDMSEFLGCWVVSTYATDVFDTVGYIWPNGEKGSGKSQCLKTVMSLAFMGQTVTSSSSFASIRDEAALGATLGFDDCENLHRMDESKRELLLAGNTKGAQVMHKEPGKKEGQWNTRFIDAFAPRAFTSIGIPDDTLASRTVMIPLVRSGDKEKTSRKPTNDKDWGNVVPADLRDQLWLNVALGLSKIEELKESVNKCTDRSGRDFDIFQGPLTVALWLEKEHRVDGLFSRMLNVMEIYHQTKQKNLLPSTEQVVLQALVDELDHREANMVILRTQDIVTRCMLILRHWDITDESLISLDTQKVGMLLGRLGFKKSGTHGKARSWEIARDKVAEKAKVAGITLETAPSDHAAHPEHAARPARSRQAAQDLPW